MSKLERPPALNDGLYWIGRFEIDVKDDQITVSPRQIYNHNHERIDTLSVTHVLSYVCKAKLISNEDSNKAERRILDLISSKKWKPRKFKAK